MTQDMAEVSALAGTTFTAPPPAPTTRTGERTEARVGGATGARTGARSRALGGARGTPAPGVRRGPRRSSPAPSASRRPMRLPEVVLGVLLVAGCALGAVLWERSTNTTSTVVVASRHIERGAVIGVDDLRGARVGGEIAALIRGADAQLLLGKTALVDIGADVPFTESLVTDAALLGADEALSSVALEPGQLPPDLAAGDHVRIVVTMPAVPGEATPAAMLDQTATVWAVDAAPGGATTVVTVRGPLDIGTQFASASAIRLVRVEGR